MTDVIPVLYVVGTIVSLMIGGLGALYGWMQAGTLRDAVGATQTFARMYATYLRIKDDGKVTIEENGEFGQLGVAFFEEMEAILGKAIYNDRAVPHVLPAKVGSEPGIPDLTDTLMSIETLLPAIKSIIDNQAAAKTSVNSSTYHSGTIG